MRDQSKGQELWQRVKLTGQEFAIGPGAPNDLERLESGLISYGADARHLTYPLNPFELGMEKLVDLDCADDFVGCQALEAILKSGVKHRRVGLFIDGPPVIANPHPLDILYQDKVVGFISDMAYSNRLQKNIGVGIISNQIDDSQQQIRIKYNDATLELSITSLPFI